MSTMSDDEPEEPIKKKKLSNIEKFNIQKAKDKNKDLKQKADTYLIENNRLLMKQTSYTEEHFKGMPALAVNKFLKNAIAAKEKEKPQEPSAPKMPNTPITGTPAGSGQKKRFIDKFLTIDPKANGGRGEIRFEAPGSVVFQKHNTINEAKKKWSEVQ